MKILYLDNPTFFANMDMLEAFEHYRDEDGKKANVLRYKYDYDESKIRVDEEFEFAFLKHLRQCDPSFVFSINFLPVVSKVCNIDGVPYVSWVYDNPELTLYSYQVINPCNTVLLFDTAQCDELVRVGIRTVEYLPLAASTKRLDAMALDEKIIEKYASDVSFVGSLYTEKRHYYDEMVQKLDAYTKGYLEGLVISQMQVEGYNFIEDCLAPEIVNRMSEASGFHAPFDSAETLEHLYANSVINRQITVMERRELLSLIGREYPIRLYTYTRNKDFSPEGVENMGPADYYTEMPYVFKSSRINLNITLRSIKNGIPLRAYDIMGAGGFLMSNYQTDLTRHFVPGEDYVYYDGRRDLLDKIGYYLKHENERKEIARRAHDKVAREHTFDVRAGQIIDIVRRKYGC